MIVQATEDINPQGFTGDRYERLLKGADLIAADPNVENSDELINGEFLRTYVEELINSKIFDLPGMSERDCNTASMLIVLDALRGPEQISWRISEWLKGNRLGRDDEAEDDNYVAVASALAAALHVMLGGFAYAFCKENGGPPDA